MRALLSIPVGILAVLALAACTAAPPALTPEGARVRVAAGSAELAGCEELRPVEAPES